MNNCPFAVKLDRCVEGCNTLSDLSNRVCLLKKAEDLNLNVFDFITGINESKILTKHISYKCVNASLMVENVTRIKSGSTINVSASAKIQKNIMQVKTIIFGILIHVVAKMVNLYEVLLTIQ